LPRRACPLPHWVAAVTDLPPTKQTTAWRSPPRCGAGVASRYRDCGPMFTPDEAAEARITALPPALVGSPPRRRAADAAGSSGFSGSFVRPPPCPALRAHRHVSKCCRILHGVGHLAAMARPMLRASYRTPKDDHP